MDTSSVARKLVEAILDSPANVMAYDLKTTEAFTKCNAIWTINRQHFTAGTDNNNLRSEILEIYHGNPNKTEDVAITGFYSRVLSRVTEIPIRLDLYDISKLGEATVGYMGFAFFRGGRLPIDLIVGQFETYRTHNVNKNRLAEEIKKHFSSLITSLTDNEIDTVYRSGFITDLESLYQRYFEISLNLPIELITIIKSRAFKTTDSTVKELHALEERVEKLSMKKSGP